MLRPSSTNDNCLELVSGEVGGGNGPASENLMRHPANFRDKAMMGKATDAELFYKMTKGRVPMPSWAEKMTDAERWQMVNYLRTLAGKPDPNE